MLTWAQSFMPRSNHVNWKFTLEKVLSVHRWTNTLFSFTMTRPAHFKFTAGQFARIGLKVGDELVVRAYSVVSSPFAETLEFFSIVVPDGAFTSNLQHLQVGDELYLEKNSVWFFDFGALSIACTTRFMVTGHRYRSCPIFIHAARLWNMEEISTHLFGL